MSKFDAREYLRNKRKDEEEEDKKAQQNVKSDTFNARDYLNKKNTASKIGFDTFSDDLNATNEKLNSIVGGWQDTNTMASSRDEISKMYDRIKLYNSNRESFGADLPDLTELSDYYKNVLDEWDSRAEMYGGYENADAYNKAVEATRKKAEADAAYNKRVREANLLEENSELAYLESSLRTAKTKKAEADSKEDDYISDIDAGDYNDTSRSRGRAGASRRNNKEFRNYMDSIGYSSIEELEKAIAEKKSFIGDATIIQDERKALNSDDFEKFVEIGKAQEFKDLGLSTVGNEVEHFKQHPTAMKGQLSTVTDEYTLRDKPELALAAYGTEEEQSIYNFYFGQESEGIADKGTADRYIETIMPRLEERWQNEKLTNLDKLASGGFWSKAGASALSVGHSLLGAGEYIVDSIDYAKTGEMDDNFYARASSTIRGRVSEDVDWKIDALDGWDAFDFVYNTGMSAIDSATVMWMPGGMGSAVLGLSAAGQGVNDALDRGLSNDQAFWQGFASGAFEMAFEKLSIGNFKAFKDMSVDGWKTAFKNLGKTMFVNASEEMLTEFANIMYDTIAHGDLSQYEMRVQELLDSDPNMSEAEAKRKAALEFGAQIGEAGLSGGFMGLVFGSVGNAGASINTNSIGKSITANNNVDKVFNMAQISPEASAAYEAYTNYANKGISADNAKAKQVGALSLNLKQDAVDILNDSNSTEAEKAKAEQVLRDLDAYSQNTSVSRFGKGKVKELFGNKEKVQTLIDDALKRGEGTEAYKLASEYKAKIESGKELSEKELTKLVDVTTSEVKDTVRVDAEQKLRELGETENAVELSKIISKAATGQMLSSAETEAIANNENARKVFAEMDKSSNIELMEASEAYEGGDAELFLENYEGGDIDKYRASFDFVSSLAKNNYDADFILEHRGALTPRQVQNIYSKVVAEPRAEQQRKLDELVKNHEGQLVRKANIDDSIFNGAKGQKLWRNLNSRQKKAITFVKAFAKGAGINLKITYDGKYKGKAYNGYYDHDTNTIVIDARAGFDRRYISEDAIIPTMSHELTHWMKQKSPELYAKLSKQIFDVFKAKGYTEYDLIATEQGKHPDMSDDAARDEIIARACEDLFKMSEEGKKIFDSLSEAEKKTLTEKIKKIIRNLIDWANELLGLYESKSDEAGWLREFKDELAEISKTWDQMLAKAVEVNAALEGEGVFGNLENGISEDGTTIVGEGVLQMSEKTYYDGGRNYLAKWLKRQKGLTQEDKDDILRQTDKVAEIMRAVAEGNELPDYSRWANLEVVKDEKGEKVLSVIVKNGDYTMNIDFSQVCKKRVALNAVLNAMVQAGDLNVHVLTETDVADLNAIIKKHDFEIACALCFVDSKRYRVGAWAESFCEGTDTDDGTHKYGFNEMVRSLVPKGSKINVDEFNFTKRDIKNQPTKNLLSEASDSELDFSLIDKIMSENDVRSAQHRYARAIKENPQIRKILNSAEIISSIGLDAIRLEAPALYNIINGHQGTAKPKFSHDAVAYGNDVLKARGFTAKRAKMVGGVRCQSFSDFMANMVVDYAQFISELAAKRLTSHAYTKEPLFVKLFGLTGMKINMSLVPKAVDMTAEQQKQFAILKDKNADKNSEEYKAALEEYEKLAENAGLDENGNYIWEDETFPYDIAMEIVDDPRYSANCGTIAVGISKAHILKLLADDKISMVIPYHKSGLNRDVAMMRDIALYHDYTSVQNTRYANDEAMYGDDAGKKLNKDKGDRDFDFYGDLYGVGKKEGTHDPKKTAQNYLDWCDKHNYTPRFDEFRDHPNYYKLLVDFRVYDTDGTYREQQAVKAIYPEEAEFKDLILNGVKDKDGKVYGGLLQSQETSDRLKAETKQIVDEYREVLAEKYGQDVLGVQMSEKDTEGNTLSKGQVEFFKDSKVRDRNGSLLVMYHGTKEDFTVFDKSKLKDALGFFFTEDKREASEYGTPKATYLNIKKPFDMFGDTPIENFIGNSPKNIDGHFNWDAAVKGLVDAGYDGVYSFSHGTKWYIAFNPEQIKSIENKNPTSNPDIRFSEKDTGTSAYDIIGEKKALEKRYNKLAADFANYKERVKLDKTLTKGKVIDPKQLEAVARYLVKFADSDYKTSELAKVLNDLYVDIQDGAKDDSMSWDEMYSKAYEVAKEIRSEAKIKIERPALYDKILKDIRSARIAPNDGQKGDAKHRFGEHYVGKFRGRVTIANDGTPLDIKWSEWAAEYPSVFDKDIGDAQQLVELYDIYDDLRNAGDVVQEYEESEVLQSLATEIINKAWTVTKFESTADKQNKRIQELNAEHRKAMEELRESYEAKATATNNELELYQKLYGDMWSKRREAYAKAKELGRKKLARYKENAERKSVIQTITGDCLRLNKMLVTNSKDLHIHEALKGPVMELLTAIDFSSKRMLDKGIPTQKDISLEAALTKVKDMMKDASDGDLDLVHLYGHNLDEDIKKMMESVTAIRRSFADNEFVLQRMSLDDLVTLKKIVKTIKSAVNKLNEFHIVQHAKGIAHLSQESIEYLDSLGRGKIFDGIRGKLDKTMVWNNTLPYYAFKRYGEGGTLVYEALMDGWDRFAFNIDEIMRFTQSVYTDKEVDAWDVEVKTFKIAVPATEAQLADPDYKPKFQEVQMTVSQIMSLYCLQKREQAHKHLLEGGIRVDNFKKKNGEIVTQEDGAVLTAKDIETIISSLSVRQRAVADKLQEFLNTVCSDWGNEVSMARFGIRQFGEVYYFPIKSDDANITQDEAKEEADSFFKLLGASFAKGLTEGANNRIVISNIFDVFAKHTSDMAKYNALALPVLDAFRWYNYKGKEAVGDEGAFISYSLKQSMKRAYGDDGLKYFTQFLKDINGTKTVSRDTLGGGFIKNDKIASVGANLRVIFLQPTSYVRASAVIDNKYLTKALTFKDKARGKAADMAEKYCGIALWKSLGYYDTNVQQGVTDQIKHKSNWHDRATDLSMKGASMADRLTWGLLWNACELEIRDTRKDLKVGSEEFYKAISKRLREVIYATQVVDSTMTRSQMMRSGDKLDKLTTSFMSEPTLSYNMVLDAVMDIKLESRRNGSKNAWKKYGWKLARTAYAYTMTNALAALIETAFDAYRDDDDEEKDLLDYVKRYFANFAEDMSIVGKIPILKDVLSIIQGYGASYSVLAGFEGLYKAVTQWWKIFTTDKGNPATALKNTLKALSSISGLPLYNVYRDVSAGLDKFFGVEIKELLNDLVD